MPQIVSREAIILLCARSLRLYDDRLVEHGERVAYLADCIAGQMPPETFDRKTLLTLCLFHDVGAYKTEEIDRMVEFETQCVQAHSIYGYLFLKYCTPMRDMAEAILYHHVHYEKLKDVPSDAVHYAELIFLADRADIGIGAGMNREELLSALRSQTGVFAPDLLDAFERAADARPVLDEVREGNAVQKVLTAVAELNLSAEEAVSYLKMLVFSIDFKSKFTVVHSINTTVISLYLARCMGLSEVQREKIYYAALIHDVGKMAIPAAILEFPGRLSPEQMAVMRRHVEYTAEIVSGVLPPDITAIAARHHEKLDGSGYPHGLTAEQLSVSDRIVAVADIISALGSRRSYKEPFGREQILKIIDGMAAGGQLDRTVVGIVDSHYDSLSRVMEKKTAPVIALYETIQREYAKLMKSPILQDAER